MKNIYLCLIAIMASWLNSNAQCILNGDFETGNLTAYTFTNTNSTINPNACGIDLTACNVVSNFPVFTPGTALNSFGAKVSLTSAGTNDVTLNSVGIQIPVVHNGTRAVKLNNNGGGQCDITTMSQVIVPAGTSISFHFSLIVQNPHPDQPNNQPFFSVRVYDIVTGNNIMNSPFCITADANNQIFDSAQVGNNQVLYTGWECGRIGIPEQYIGENVRLEFMMADCGVGLHFGTVYIDDITCDASCTDPVFGFLELDPEGYSCPTAPFQVCGTYINPQDGELQNIQLAILDGDTVVTTITQTSQLTNETFCFTVDPSLFGNSGYEFLVTSQFLIDGAYLLVLQDASSISGNDISFSGIDIAEDYIIDTNDQSQWPSWYDDELTWLDIADSYQLEFVSDDKCAYGFNPDAPVTYYSTTVQDNRINIISVANALNSSNFRWRIKAGECEWSEWCCLAFNMLMRSQDNFDSAGWLNFHWPECYPGEVETCEPYLYEENPVVTQTTSIESREISIIALNTIEPLARATYLAGKFVEMRPGFKAESGSVFLGNIENCAAQEDQQEKPKKIVKFNGNEKSSEFERYSDVAGFTVFPNPSEDFITVSGIVGADVYSIRDISGKELLRMQNNAKEKQVRIDIRQLTSGIYFILADGNLVQKLIKK